MTDPSALSTGGQPPATVAIRSIRPDDASGLRALHARLSDETIRNRFFGPHRFLPEDEVRRFTSPVAGRDVALVATAADDIVGVGRSIRLAGRDLAEVAFVVEDDYQGRGIGSALLTLLAHIAWDDGIRRFVADTFVTNQAMLGVFLHTPRAVAVTATRRDGAVVHLVMSLVPPGDSLALASDQRTPAPKKLAGSDR
jgi:GNAT superfamily N-acetyltransferase